MGGMGMGMGMQVRHVSLVPRVFREVWSHFRSYVGQGMGMGMGGGNGGKQSFIEKWSMKLMPLMSVMQMPMMMLMQVQQMVQMQMMGAMQGFQMGIEMFMQAGQVRLASCSFLLLAPFQLRHLGLKLPPCSGRRARAWRIGPRASRSTR